MRQPRSGVLQWNTAARIPCREAHKGIHQAERESQGRGTAPAQPADRGKQVQQNGRERAPARKVEQKPPEAAENGMHERLYELEHGPGVSGPSLHLQMLARSLR